MPLDDNLLDVPVDVMVEEVATDFIPNNANTMFGSTSHESNTISDDLRNEHFIHVISPAKVAPPTADDLRNEHFIHVISPAKVAPPTDLLTQQDTQTEVTTSNVPLKRKFTEPWNFGKPTQTCESCGAILWYEERNVKSRRPSQPKFSLCCSEGLIYLLY
ncbi:uncharacterized protein LOC112004501 isoform X2 [Quercus suber]|uniref:uncharacterized protein LOC112004501 isoform X2 n=1 Tax=Quercus suber TaxID=58331 RepID=UPI0032DF4580